jgi:hypothetical protein
MKGSRVQGFEGSSRKPEDRLSNPRTLEPLDPLRKFWRPDVQTLPREQIQALQLARLQRLLQRIWERRSRSFAASSRPRG